MELEEMKILWSEMSAEIEKQKKITDALVIKMTQVGYKNKIRKILIPEIIGSLVCCAEFIYILLNFQKLDTWYLLICGIIASLILFILPVFSFRAARTISAVNVASNNYKQLLLKYSKGKKQLVFVQKLSFYLGAMLIVVILPVTGKIMAGKNVFLETKLWLWYTVAFPFFYAFAKWVFKNYNKTSKEAEKMLKELEN